MRELTTATPPGSEAHPPVYEPPRILEKIPLKHFTGSPLMGGPFSPEDLLGLPPGQG
jgi:hypothetical protein